MKQITKFFVAALAVAGLTGCSDEVEYNSISELPEGIYITIPDPLGGEVPTRALEGGDPSQTVQIEGKLNDLWLIVFDEDGNYFKSDNILDNVAPVRFKDEAGKSTVYNITDWFQGTDGGALYKLYLVANLDAYTTDKKWKGSLKENELIQTVMNFRDGEAAYLLNHSKVKDQGLPMACLNGEIKVKAPGEAEEVGRGLTVTPGGNALITGNLKFLCSKVRYTLLFDNSETGFSYDVFGTHKLNLTGASVTGVCEGGQTVSIDARTPSGSYSLSNISLKKVAYPENPDTYPSAAQKNVNLAQTTDQSGAKHAWQGVVYLPANPDDSKPTTLNFTGYVDNENGAQVKYTIPLVPNGTGVKSIRAGKYYDIAAQVTGLETITVNKPTVETDWNRTQLLYSLMQNLFLKVNPTAIEKVEAGKTYSMYYSTNGLVEFKSPEYNGIELYEHEFRGDSLYINVNPLIEAESFSTIMAQAANYKWFEIKTGGGIITKRIDINELDLRQFINITPDRMAINMSELVASGSYNNPETATEFEIETNAKSFWIEMDNWPNSSNASTNHLWVEIQDPTTKEWSTVKCLTSGATVTDDYKIEPKDGARKFRLRYEGLNNGYPIWEKAEQYKLNFMVDAAISSLYEVDVVPSHDSYIIHVKAKNSFFTKAPHCYIYQCLEVPSTYDGTWKRDEVDIPLANMPVAGVNNNDPNQRTANVSALEYSFTGKIAFKGWDWYKNADTLKNKEVDTSQGDNGWHRGNFIRFQGDWNMDSNSDGRYYTDMDFFADYRNDRSSCKCDACRDAYNVGWPGIMMKDEGNSWYTLELTGAATPGRALIIWTAEHGGGNQYPKEAGERLFDFPSKEAWIVIESSEKASKWFQTKAEADAY